MNLRRPLSVQVFLVALIEGDHTHLLLRRRERPELGLPAFWQGVSGALKSGEDFDAAARREVFEETGIRLSFVVDTGFLHRYPVRPEWRPWYGPDPEEVQEHVFYALVAPSVAPTLSSEHDLWRWCSPREARNLLTFGANAACLQAVESRLTQSCPAGVSDAPLD